MWNNIINPEKIENMRYNGCICINVKQLKKF